MNNMKICIIYSVNVREPGASCLDSFVITKDTKQKVLTIKFYWLVNLETLQYILFQFLFKMLETLEDSFYKLGLWIRIIFARQIIWAYIIRILSVQSLWALD